MALIRKSRRGSDHRERFIRRKKQLLNFADAGRELIAVRRNAGSSLKHASKLRGLPGQPYRYTGTDVLEEHDGRVAVFYTFVDSGTPPVTAKK